MTDRPITHRPDRVTARVSRRSLLAAGGGLAALALGGGYAFDRAATGRPVVSAQSGAASDEPSAAPSGERVDVTIYLVSLASNRLGPQLRPWPATVSVDPDDRRVAAAALEAVLAGPDDLAVDAGFVSALPEGIEVVSAELVDDETNVVQVELSPGWLEIADEAASAGPSARPSVTLRDRLETPAAGQPGTETERELRLRVAQVVFTLTQFDTIDAVEFILDQETLGAIGDLGSVVEDGPADRLRFDDLVPLVMIEGPLAFDTVGRTFDVYGSANTFEAALSLRLESADGETLLEEPQTAISGNGVRGTFSATLTVPDGTPAGPLTLIGFEYSARDGSETNRFEVPLEYDPEA